MVIGYANLANNCSTRNGVVTELRTIGELGAPVLGNNVDFAADAKVLGKIRIGNSLPTAANAAVSTDVPDNWLALAIPAIVGPRSPDSGIAK